MSDEKIVGIVNDLFGAGRLNFCVLNDLVRGDSSLNKEKKTCLHKGYISLLGFDTISTALSWSVMYLVAHPEMQERLHQELSK